MWILPHPWPTLPPLKFLDVHEQELISALHPAITLRPDPLRDRPHPPRVSLEWLKVPFKHRGISHLSVVFAGGSTGDIMSASIGGNIFLFRFNTHPIFLPEIFLPKSSSSIRVIRVIL